jgi:hypothetical protein
MRLLSFFLGLGKVWPAKLFLEHKVVFLSKSGVQRPMTKNMQPLLASSHKIKDEQNISGK